jgi:hypothetical protein
VARGVYERPPTPTETATGLAPEKLPTDPDLAAVIDVWNRLAEAVAPASWRWSDQLGGKELMVDGELRRKFRAP